MIHKEHIRETIQPIKCPNCEYKCLLNRQMKNHIKSTHINQNQECKYKCNFCGFESDILITMYEHKFEEHPDEPVEFHPNTKSTKDFILNMMAEQNMAIMEEFLTLKQTMITNSEKLANDLKNTCEKISFRKPCVAQLNFH